MMEKAKRFWEDGLSIDETRVSSLIIGLFMCLVFMLVAISINLALPAWYADVLKTLIWGVCGVNVIEKVKTYFNASKGSDVTTSSTEYKPFNGTTNNSIFTNPKNTDI